MHRWRSAFALLAALLSMGCPPPYAVWLVAGSTAANLRVAHSVSRGGNRSSPVLGLDVRSCGGYREDLTRIPQAIYWLVRSQDPDGGLGITAPQVTYGRTPAGLVDSIGPRDLDPGCYWFTVFANPGVASVRFWIAPDGTAREFTRRESDSADAILGAHTQATLRADEEANRWCRDAYIRAGADSAATAVVDSAVPYDSTRFEPISCAALKRLDRRARLGGEVQAVAPNQGLLQAGPRGALFSLAWRARSSCRLTHVAAGREWPAAEA